MPLFNKHINEIKTELETAFKDATTPNIDLSPNTPIGNIIQQQSRNFTAVIDAINTLENKVNLNLATGADLTNLALLHGIQRLPGLATAIKVDLHFKDASHLIKAGTQFKFDNDDNLIFSLDKDLNVDEFTKNEVDLTCIYQNNELVNEHMAGVAIDDHNGDYDFITNITITSFKLGYAYEDDQMFRQRIISILQGEKSTLMVDPEIARIKKAVLKVPYVEYVYCVHDRTAHTIKVYVDGNHYKNDEVAKAIFDSVTAGVQLVGGAGAITETIKSLDNQSHQIHFHKATVKDISVAMTIYMDEVLYKHADYEVAIKNIIMNYVNHKPINGKLYAAELNKIIMDQYNKVMIVISTTFNHTGSMTGEMRPKTEIDRINITWSKPA